MINIKDTNDVQIWCDFQEEKQQTNANFFLRLRFSNFYTFMSVVKNYGDGNGWGIGYGGDRLGDGFGDGYGTSSGNGIGYGDAYRNGSGFGDGDGFGGGEPS